MNNNNLHPEYYKSADELTGEIYYNYQYKDIDGNYKPIHPHFRLVKAHSLVKLHHLEDKLCCDLRIKVKANKNLLKRLLTGIGFRFTDKETYKTVYSSNASDNLKDISVNLKKMSVNLDEYFHKFTVTSIQYYNSDLEKLKEDTDSIEYFKRKIKQVNKEM
tara:strand:+ start:1933 stop:2415 length:483 start_codon:yes stop_codon:yes gene_type:complete